MPDKSLYLFQSDYIQTQHHLNQIPLIYTQADALVLLGEAVLFVEDLRLVDLHNVYILANDAEMLINEIPSHISVLNYAEFADLVLMYKRCISFS